MAFNRRQFLNYFVVGGTISALWNVGCESEEQSESKDKPESITLTFQESDEFYEQLTTAINKGRDVQVKFDGANRIGKDSRMLEKILPKAENRQKVFDEIEKLGESQDGRDKLRNAFTDELVETTVATEEMRRPNGEVIGPGTTVLLVISVLLMASATAYASHKHMEIGRPFAVEIGAGPIYFKFHSKPIA